jgi:uncharacterized protein YjdB
MTMTMTKAKTTLRNVATIVACLAAMIMIAVACGKDKEPVIPVITIGTQPTAPSGELMEGSISGTLTITASVTEGGTLTFQWYTNTSASNTGGTAISGATSGTYTLPADLKAGTWYYFCEVTAGDAEGKRSSVVTVTVKAIPALEASGDTYEIPAIVIGEAIAALDLSGAISGGTKPYTFSATGLPAGITISAEGVISGRPTEATPAGKAIVTVKDSSSPAKTVTITVDYGAISLPEPAIIPVKRIANLPTEATAGTVLTLSGDVEPTDATNKTIAWSLKSAGKTGATISGASFYATSDGAATVTATITDGLGKSEDYTEDFDIEVKPAAPTFTPVTGISGVPTAATANAPLTLSGTVAPSDATNKSITWSIKEAGTTGATVSGASFYATSDGTATVTATITDGLGKGENYTDDFDIEVKPAAPTEPLLVDVTPVDVSVEQGEEVKFTATVTGGTAPYEYQWRLGERSGIHADISDGALYSGTKDPILTVKADVSMNNKTFECFVTDDTGNKASSNRVILRVKEKEVLLAEGTTGYVTWKLSSDGTLTITGTGRMGLYSMEDDRRPPWFKHSNVIKKVVIGNGVTIIGNEAFWGCTSLTTVTIGDGVTEIGDYAFDNCTSLTAITIPDGVTEIRSAAFRRCDALTTVTLGDGLTKIGEQAFFDCISLKAITIPVGVTEIGKSAFRYCEVLTSVTCMAVNPPKITTPFDQTPDNKKLYVPSGSVGKYESSDWADMFTNIEGI